MALARIGKMAISSVKAKEKADVSYEQDDPAFIKIRDLVYRISGIYHSEQKLYLLTSSCVRRMQSCGASTPLAYLECLTISADREAELRLLLNEITIGETYMFRHPAQLEDIFADEWRRLAEQRPGQDRSRAVAKSASVPARIPRKAPDPDIDDMDSRSEERDRRPADSFLVGGLHHGGGTVQSGDVSSRGKGKTTGWLEFRHPGHRPEQRLAGHSASGHLWRLRLKERER